MNPFYVIVKPLLSEKSNQVREQENKYTFIIRKEASKADVRKAISAMWNIDVLAVRTLIQRGKFKRRGSKYSQTSLTKKAVVTLAEGVKLPIFEDQ